MDNMFEVKVNERGEISLYSGFGAQYFVLDVNQYYSKQQIAKLARALGRAFIEAADYADGRLRPRTFVIKQYEE